MSKWFKLPSSIIGGLRENGYSLENINEQIFRKMFHLYYFLSYYRVVSRSEVFKSQWI